MNEGCIPSKTLLAGAEMWENILNAEAFGITVENPRFDYSKMVDRKNRVVEKARKREANSHPITPPPIMMAVADCMEFSPVVWMVCVWLVYN